MRVLQLCNKAPYPPKDGGAHASWQLAKGLAGNGIEVTLLYMNTSKHRVHDVVLPPSFRKNIKYMGVPVKTDTGILPALLNLFFSGLPYNLARFNAPDFEKKLIEILHENTFDTIICDGLPLALFIPVLRKHSTGKILLRAHNVEYGIWEDLQTKAGPVWKRWYLSIFARRLKTFEMEQLSRIDALVPISREDFELFQQHGYTGPSFILPYAPDPGKSKEKQEIKPDLLYLGALDWKPNISAIQWFVRNVWPGIFRKHPEIRLHIAGRNPHPSLKKIFDKPGIRFYGEISDTDRFYEKGDIFLVPLFTGSGMRVKIIEAMMKGMVVVTTSPGLKGIPAEPGKHVITADSSEEFIQQISLLVADPARGLEISHNAGRFVQTNFNNFRHTKDFTEFIKSLLS